MSGGLLACKELAVSAVREKVARAQIEGDFGGCDFDFADSAEESGGLFELKKLEVAAWRKLLLNHTECFDS